jgi:hypothetical protein
MTYQLQFWGCGCWVNYGDNNNSSQPHTSVEFTTFDGAKFVAQDLASVGRYYPNVMSGWRIIDSNGEITRL